MKWKAHFGKQFHGLQFLKMLEIEFKTTYILKRNEDICLHKNVYINVYSYIIYEIQKEQTNQVSNN